jgi:hypothetical protein
MSKTIENLSVGKRSFGVEKPPQWYLYYTRDEHGPLRSVPIVNTNSDPWRPPLGKDVILAGKHLKRSGVTEDDLLDAKLRDD